MKKLLLFLSLVIGMALHSTAQGYTIEFVTSSTSTSGTTLNQSTKLDAANLFSDGNEYVSKFIGGANANYNVKGGIRMGTAKALGSVGLQTNTLGYIETTEIVVSAKLYDNSAEVSTATLTISVNGTYNTTSKEFRNALVSETFSSFDKKTYKDCVIKLPAGTKFDNIFFETGNTATSTKNCRINIASITVKAPVAGLEDAEIKLVGGAEVSVIQGAADPELPTFTAKEGVALSYASSEPSVATVDAEGKVTIVGAGSTVISCKPADESKYYGSANYTLTVIAGWASVADFLASAEGEKGIFTTELTAIYQNGKNLYATDGKNELLVFGNLNTTYKNGDVIPAGASGSYTLYNDVTPELEPNAATFGAGTAGTAVNPTELEPKAVADAEINSYVKVSGLTLTAPDNNNITATAEDGTTFTVRNQFYLFNNFMPVDGAKYIVEGFIGQFNKKNQIGAISITQDMTAAATALIAVDAEGWYNRDKSEVYTNATVTVSSSDGDEEAIICASVNGTRVDNATGTLTINVADYTNAGKLDIRAWLDDDTEPAEGVTTMSLTIGKVPAPAFSVPSGDADYGTVVTVTCSVEGAHFVGLLGDDEIDEALPYEFTITADTEISGWVEADNLLDSEAVEMTYTAVIPVTGEATWVPLATASQITDGTTVAIYAKEYTGKASGANVTYPELIMGPPADKAKVLPGFEYSYANEKITMTKESTNFAELTFEKSGDNWLLKSAQGYLVAGDKSATFTDSKESATAFTVSVAEDGAVAIAKESYTLQYNPSIKNPVDITTARFAFYSSKQQPIYMYVKKAGEFKMPEIEMSVNDTPLTSGTAVSEGTVIKFTSPEGSELFYMVEEIGVAMGDEPSRAGAEWTSANGNTWEYTVPADANVKVSTKYTLLGSESPVNELNISGGIATGIETVTAAGNDATAVWYNLQGLRVAEPTPGAVYIRVEGNRATKVRL